VSVMAQTTADRGRQVRQRLLATAAELVAERGWTAVSTRMIAERAGVTAGVVHYHFASVQALLSEAALSVMRGLLDQMLPALARVGTADEALGMLLAVLDEYDGRDPTSLLLAETYLAATRDEGLRRTMSQGIEEFRQVLADRLAVSGVDAPQATGALLAAAIDGIVLHRALLPGLHTADLLPVLRRLITSDRAGRARNQRPRKKKTGEDS
jgi:AcrR family transcriptional regulator